MLGGPLVASGDELGATAAAIVGDGMVGGADRPESPIQTTVANAPATTIAPSRADLLPPTRVTVSVAGSALSRSIIRPLDLLLCRTEVDVNCQPASALGAVVIETPEAPASR